ncbi:metal-dependent hydrolase [Teichococcus vastitatis]|uniref:Metal-dependent hydrolase n=1 Tax=Teichococcus vastitatis TaxID=2307076 RepID=A0ABS9WCF8_9PROT|nr:metal-dependent hydrolase [Pseudoroseomonas vastitatis]MCI0756959.1 metal-dependent hydrolase [Pseudoroseomonas vastitatis]
MDSVTQALFGATVAAAGFHRTLGRRAVAAGAVLGTVPDLDVAVGWVADGFANWRHHRGITHSILFGPVVGPFIGRAIAGWEARRRGSADPVRMRAWMWLCVLVLLTHPVIDVFTSYGTQLLAPLSDHRFALNAMPIIDPIYSAVLLLAVLVAGFSRRSDRAVPAAALALLFITGWTLHAWAQGERTVQLARAQLAGSGITATSIEAYPLLFQPWYRRIVAEAPDGLRIGRHSLLAPGPIPWTHVPQEPDPRFSTVAALPEARLLRWFARGHLAWSVNPAPGGGSVVEVSDTRYGMADSSLLGFWGIRVPLDAGGRVLGRAEIFTRRPAADAAFLGRFWRELTQGPGSGRAPAGGG